MVPSPILSSFFFNDTATTEIYTLSLHDALPIYRVAGEPVGPSDDERRRGLGGIRRRAGLPEQHRGAEEERSEEHTSELQSPCNLVCRLLLEKKKNKYNNNHTTQRLIENNYNRIT